MLRLPEYINTTPQLHYLSPQLSNPPHHRIYPPRMSNPIIAAIGAKARERRSLPTNPFSSLSFAFFRVDYGLATVGISLSEQRATYLKKAIKKFFDLGGDSVDLLNGREVVHYAFTDYKIARQVSRKTSYEDLERTVSDILSIHRLD